MFKSLIVPAAAGIAVLATPAAALAGENLSQNRVVVSINDLDISTSEGAAEMQKRVRAATYKACLFDEKGQIVSPEAQNACARVAMKKSETQMAQKIANVRYGG
ncbi:UrcA family protein [Croceicoccus bisphenolivorans]|uniref:UrcA family protein n=1 Tax=Croceicoccus bisphenolivorans TaxID=1783232 RepID=UPI000830C1D4|nr:UrcA family protein [Croceicoccus bisphenolivorans]